MANTLQINTSTVVGGLATQTATIVTAGLYTVAVQTFLPYQASGTSANSSVITGGSGLSVVVKQNGSTVMTLSGPAPTQPTLAGKVVLNCAANDSITIDFNTTTQADLNLNAVKSIVNVYQGE